MINKVFLDTNLWLYAMIEQNNKQKQQQVEALLTSEDNEIYITTQVINEISYQLQKNAIAELQIEQIIQSFYDKYVVVNISKPILLIASQIRGRYSFAFWDSQIIASAIHAECNYLYSEFIAKNLSLTEEGGLKIINPFLV